MIETTKETSGFAVLDMVPGPVVQFARLIGELCNPVRSGWLDSWTVGQCQLHVRTVRKGERHASGEWGWPCSCRPAVGQQEWSG